MPVHLLEAVSKHGPINLVQQSRVDMDAIVGVDPHEVLVVRRMLDLANGHAVGGPREPSFMPVRQNVRGVE
ncbi:hypothetical protein U6G28_03610 [Actinomycetaceae bacterium MB13-C1-2]|nr:hypothetical protein U6G28_03610 [Actinomycetaceae bacterium MB13-C1-2]